MGGLNPAIPTTKCHVIIPIYELSTVDLRDDCMASAKAGIAGYLYSPLLKANRFFCECLELARIVAFCVVDDEVKWTVKPIRDQGFDGSILINLVEITGGFDVND